jgi:hypothetical protein
MLVTQKMCFCLEGKFYMPKSCALCGLSELNNLNLTEMCFAVNFEGVISLKSTSFALNFCQVTTQLTLMWFPSNSEE